MESFTKQSSEVYAVSFQFSGKLPTGASLASCTVAAINTSTLVDASATVLSSTTATISGTLATVTVQAGEHGYDYQLSFVALLSPGSPIPVLEEDLLLMIRNI
jgi:hypothetical protein